MRSVREQKGDNQRMHLLPYCAGSELLLFTCGQRKACLERNGINPLLMTRAFEGFPNSLQRRNLGRPNCYKKEE